MLGVDFDVQAETRSTCRIRAAYSIEFLKKTWMRGVIESSANPEIDKLCKAFVEFIQRTCVAAGVSLPVEEAKVDGSEGGEDGVSAPDSLEVEGRAAGSGAGGVMEVLVCFFGVWCLVFVCFGRKRALPARWRRFHGVRVCGCYFSW